MIDTIFVSNSCPSCHVVEDALRRQPIGDVLIRNIDFDPRAREFFDQTTGPRAVPKAVINGSPVTGAYEILRALRAKYGRP